MYQYFPLQGPPKINPKWNFWSKNTPSGNPGYYIDPMIPTMLQTPDRGCRLRHEAHRARPTEGGVRRAASVGGAGDETRSPFCEFRKKRFLISDFESLSEISSKAKTGEIVSDRYGNKFLIWRHIFQLTLDYDKVCLYYWHTKPMSHILTFIFIYISVYI
jgi:hypothetical protein